MACHCSPRTSYSKLSQEKEILDATLKGIIKSNFRIFSLDSEKIIFFF